VVVGVIMTTLSNSFPKKSDSTAVIIPGSPALTLSFSQLSAQIASFQQKLAELGISKGDAVSIALPNSIEFIVCSVSKEIPATVC
jgi:acyl-CoA synthetase (AMP-forming)/AMP-acid ligase II